MLVTFLIMFTKFKSFRPNAFKIDMLKVNNYLRNKYLFKYICMYRAINPRWSLLRPLKLQEIQKTLSRNFSYFYGI